MSALGVGCCCKTPYLGYNSSSLVLCGGTPNEERIFSREVNNNRIPRLGGHRNHNRCSGNKVAPVFSPLLTGKSLLNGEWLLVLRVPRRLLARRSASAATWCGPICGSGRIGRWHERDSVSTCTNSRPPSREEGTSLSRPRQCRRLN